MRLPDGSILMVDGEDGVRHMYDPEYARQYYLRTRKLKGRKKGAGKTSASTGLARNDRTRSALKTKKPSAVRARQRQALAARIKTLETKLHKLEAKIRKREQDDRESKKESEKPATAAEKREKAKDSKKYRDKHKQELANKAEKKSDGKKGSKESKTSTEDLKKLATKVKGQIAVAKQRLAAL